MRCRGISCAFGCADASRAEFVGMGAEMTSGHDPFDDERDGLLRISDAAARAAGQVVTQAFERVLSSDLRVTTAAEGKRLLAEDDSTEELADSIQRFVGIATPIVRIVARGARFTRVPWLLVASSSVSVGVTVRAGVRELQVLAALLAHRLEQDTGEPPAPSLLQKLTLEVYLSPRKTPEVSDLRLPVVRLARRWIISGALGRDTRAKAGKALDLAERLDVATLAAAAPRSSRSTAW
jgi:hypothetical protein